LTWLVCGAPSWSPKASSFAAAVITARRSADGSRLNSSWASASQATLSIMRRL
jgi:hypothetical protein